MEYDINTMTISQDEDILTAIEAAFDLGFALCLKPLDNFKSYCEIAYDQKELLMKKISDYLKEKR